MPYYAGHLRPVLSTDQRFRCPVFASVIYMPSLLFATVSCPFCALYLYCLQQVIHHHIGLLVV